MRKALFIIIIALMILLAGAVRYGVGQRAERIRLSFNQTALMSEVEHYVTKDGKNAAAIDILNLKVREFETLRTEDAQVIRDMGIKIKRLENYSKTVTKTEFEFKTPIIEKPVLNIDSTWYPKRLFEWSDTWAHISGVIEKDSVSCQISTIDTLRQGIERIPRKFLFIRWGTKGIKQKISVANPNTDIIYNETIIFNKR